MVIEGVITPSRQFGLDILSHAKFHMKKAKHFGGKQKKRKGDFTGLQESFDLDNTNVRNTWGDESLINLQNPITCVLTQKNMPNRRFYEHLTEALCGGDYDLPVSQDDDQLFMLITFDDGSASPHELSAGRKLLPNVGMLISKK